MMRQQLLLTVWVFLSSLATIVHSFTTSALSQKIGQCHHHDEHRRQQTKPRPEREPRRAIAMTRTRISLMMQQNERNTDHSPLRLFQHSQKALGQLVAGLALTTALWTTLPSSILDRQATVPFGVPAAAVAKEMASGSGSRVNKDPESLLRYGLPINNKDVSAGCGGVVASCR
jgi:hypothetical protein